MTVRKWTDDDARWLKANFGRMDLQTLSKELGLPLEDLERKIRQLKLAGPEPERARKTPASLKEAVRESSAARKEYEKAIELFHKRHFDEAARRFEDLIEKHPDEKEFLDRARMYLGACRTGKKTKGPSAAEPEELYHAAVFEKNRGNVDKALDLLRKNAGRRDGDGRVHYLAACCFALQGDAEQALQSLKKAIAADDQNRIQARLARHIPNLESSIVKRVALGPHDLERMNVNLLHGDPYGGALSLDQNFLWRPFPQSPGHATPIERLWHIGASTWPGPGLGAGSGTLVAQELLKPPLLTRARTSLAQMWGA